MDVLEYINPTTIPDISTRNTLATTVAPIKEQKHYSSFVSATLAGPSSNNNNNNNNKNKPVHVNDLDAGSHLTAPTFDAAGRAMMKSGKLPNIFQLCNSAVRILPKTAALLQKKVCQYVPFVWTASPPVLHVNPLASPGSHYQHHYRSEQLENFFGGNVSNNSNSSSSLGGTRTAATVARFVALHPHRRLIAVAAPHEGSSRHSAVIVYDLSQNSNGSTSSNPQPKQVLRNVLIRDLCGIEWKPGSRNVLIAYGSLGVSMFHLSVDPRTGLDVEDPKNEFLTSATSTAANVVSHNARAAARNSGAPPLVLPSAGGASSNAAPSMANADLGVGCLYPVSSQLARFGIEPQIDRISFYPDNNGRFVACGSTSSSGIRIVDLAFTPMEQLFSDWQTSSKVSREDNNNNRNKQQQKPLLPTNKLISGTFVGSPSGPTSDLSWIHPSTETSTTLLLLRAVRDANLIEIFAAGLSTPIATLNTDLPVEQLQVVPWPNLANVANQQSLNSRNVSLGIDNKSLYGPKFDSSSSSSGSSLEPNRHVGVWVLYQKTEGVVMYDLAFNEQRIHQDTPIHCVPLIRLSTTVATPFRRSTTNNSSSSSFSNQNNQNTNNFHPGGIVSRFVTVKEIGSQDSGTIFMSVDSGHVIGVKMSRTGPVGTQNKANSSFVYQTSIISPTLNDDEDEDDDYNEQEDFFEEENNEAEVTDREEIVSLNRRRRRMSNNNNNRRIAFSELVGVFGSTSNPFGPIDVHTLVTWNGQENVAKLVSVKVRKTEVNAE